MQFFNIGLYKGGGGFNTPPMNTSGMLSPKPILSYLILEFTIGLVGIIQSI